MNAPHEYKNPGTYEISLIATTNIGCKDTVNLTQQVELYQSPEVALIAPDSTCINFPVSFKAKDASRDSIRTWKWNFGNGSESIEQNPEYSYSASGAFTVSLSATNEHGCVDSSTHTITVLPLPNVNAGADSTICFGNTVTLQPSGGNSYIWTNNPSLSCLSCLNPTAKPDSTTTYYVTGADNFGCTATDSVEISVVQPINISLAVTNDTLCLGSSVQLNATGASIYTWTPSAGLSSTTIPNPIASPTVSTVYTVVGSSDVKNCFLDTAEVSVLVAPIPTFNITDSLVTQNVGSTYPILTTSSPDVISWLWTPPNGLTCSNCAAPVAQLHSNITYTATASTIFGCTASDNITINVVCNKANVYIPNTFSPNGDGRNDYFYPRGSGLFTIKSFRIFNRWGDLVFVKTNMLPEAEKEGWNGTYNGVQQQADVYVYIVDILCENGTTLTSKGNVTLVR